jgi:hypothetical protein
MYGMAFAVAALPVWRVTHLFVNEQGPWQLFHRLRLFGASIGAAKLFGCFLCFSVWAAIPFALLLMRRPLELVMLIPALSGAAILLERVTARGEVAAPLYVEEKEESDVVLR